MNLDKPVLPTPPHIVELERLGDEIAELSAHLDAATARLLDLIRDFDERGGWGNGFSSCAAWLTWRTGLDPGAARERVRVARALPALPRIAQALAHGELSDSKVRALVATPATEERLLAIGRQARPSTSSGSCAAGGAWTASPKPKRPRGAIAPASCACITMKTGWSSSGRGSSLNGAQW